MKRRRSSRARRTPLVPPILILYIMNCPGFILQVSLSALLLRRLLWEEEEENQRQREVRDLEGEGGGDREEEKEEEEG